jgi:hypothetical protein
MWERLNGEGEFDVRELTKSLTSYAWAMSMFWTQQMFNMMGLGGSGSWNRSARSMNNVTEATTNEMGDTLRAVYRSGDTLQRGMVDLFLAPFSFGNWCGGNGGRQEDSRGGSDWGPDRHRWDDAVRKDAGRRGDGTRDMGWSERPRSGWGETAARAANAGMDAVQAAVDNTARATRRATEAMTSQRPPQSSAPPASDPSLGWGPMPR